MGGEEALITVGNFGKELEMRTPSITFSTCPSQKAHFLFT